MVTEKKSVKVGRLFAIASSSSFNVLNSKIVVNGLTYIQFSKSLKYFIFWHELLNCNYGKCHSSHCLGVRIVINQIN